MLRKLLKHDLKETWKLPTILLLFLMLASFLVGLGFKTSLFDFTNMNTSASTFIMYTIVFLFYYIILIGVSLFISFYIILRFYKNIYTDEGYLTHTLPVTPTQLLNSKIIIGTLFSLIAVIGLFLSLGIVGWMAISSLSSTIATEIFGEFLLAFGSPTVYQIFCFTITLILGALQNVLMGYCAICLGQFLTKHRIIGAFLAYLGLYTLVQILSTIIMIPNLVAQMTMSVDGTYTTTVSSFGLVSGMFTSITILEIILIILTYVISMCCMKKKLNLE